MATAPLHLGHHLLATVMLRCALRTIVHGSSVLKFLHMHLDSNHHYPLLLRPRLSPPQVHSLVLVIYMDLGALLDRSRLMEAQPNTPLLCSTYLPTSPFTSTPSSVSISVGPPLPALSFSFAPAQPWKTLLFASSLMTRSLSPIHFLARSSPANCTTSTSRLWVMIPEVYLQD